MGWLLNKRPAGQELPIDRPDDMEAIGDDDGIGKVSAHQATVVGGQVHTDDFHLQLSWRTFEISQQQKLRMSQHDIVDLVILEIAERGGKAFAATEEVFRRWLVPEGR